MQCLPAFRHNSALVQNAVSSVLLKPAISTRAFSYDHKKLGGKATWLALLVVLGFLSYSTVAKGQEVCGPATIGCVWTGWTEVDVSADICTSVTMTISGIPVNCQVCFGYRFRRCGNLYQVEANKFRLENPCQDYMTGLAHGSLADHATLRTIVESMYQLGELQCAKDYFKKDVRGTNSAYDCLGPTGCSSTIGLTTVQAYSAQCYEYIVTEPTLGGSGCIGTTWRKGCDTEYCCIKSWQMCYDASTGQVRACSPTVTAYGLNPTCSGSSSFTAPSGCTIIYSSGCYSLNCPD